MQLDPNTASIPHWHSSLWDIGKSPWIMPNGSHGSDDWKCIKDGWGSSRPCWGSLVSAVWLKDLRKQIEAAALRIFCNYVHADSGSCLLGLSLSIHLVFSCSSSIVSCSVGSVVFLLPARQPRTTVKAYLLEAGCTIWLPTAQHMNFWFVCVRQHRHLLGVPVWTSSRFR